MATYDLSGIELYSASGHYLASFTLPDTPMGNIVFKWGHGFPDIEFKVGFPKEVTHEYLKITYNGSTGFGLMIVETVETPQSGNEVEYTAWEKGNPYGFLDNKGRVELFSGEWTDIDLATQSVFTDENTGCHLKYNKNGDFVAIAINLDVIGSLASGSNVTICELPTDIRGESNMFPLGFPVYVSGQNTPCIIKRSGNNLVLYNTMGVTMDSGYISAQLMLFIR